MITRAWKVFGREGDALEEARLDSFKYDFSDDKVGTRIIDVENSDKTGTDRYSIIRITRNTAEECEQELDSQIDDGVYENSRVGYWSEIEEN